MTTTPSSLRADSEWVTAWFPVRVVGNRISGSALARRVCATGMLVTARRAFEVGSSVELALHVDPENSPPSNLRGRIIESARNEEDPGGLWPYKVSIAFDIPQHALMPLLGQVRTTPPS